MGFAQQAWCALPDCPATLSDWITWRDRAIAGLLRPRTRQNQRYLDTDKLTPIAVKSAAYIDACAPSSSRPDALQAKIGNFAAFTHIFGNADHQFGYSIDDFDYLSRVQENVKLPELLTSQEFLKKISHKRTYHAAFEMIADHNALLPREQQWIVLIFKSRFLTTPDRADACGRFLIVVPGDKYQKWIQFGIKVPGDTSPNLFNKINIVSVANPDAQGRRFNAIIDWWRTYHADGAITLEPRRKASGKTDNCAVCHKTSPLGIHPDEEYVFDRSGRLVVDKSSAGTIPKQLNDMIVGYGAPYFNDWLDTAAYGPPLGENKPRTDAFMQACTSGLGLDAGSINRVKKNMACAACHAEGGAGLLNFPETTSTRRIPGNQIYQYLSQGWMPPRQQPTDSDANRLSPNEREALYTCLTKEYLDFDSMTGTFVDWLKTNGRVSYSTPQR